MREVRGSKPRFSRVGQACHQGTVTALPTSAVVWYPSFWRVSYIQDGKVSSGEKPTAVPGHESHCHSLHMLCAPALSTRCGEVDQLVDRSLRMREVRGSKPRFSNFCQKKEASSANENFLGSMRHLPLTLWAMQAGARLRRLPYFWTLHSKNRLPTSVCEPECFMCTTRMRRCSIGTSSQMSSSVLPM